MKTSIVLIFCLTTCQGLLDEWHNFKVTFTKTYPHVEEELFRRQIFEENVQRIEEHNKLYNEGKESYELGMNHLGDLTDEEFEEMYLSANLSLPVPEETPEFEMAADVSVPETLDWRQRNAVNRVKNQGRCGSCWAFSAVASLESMLFLKTGKMRSLSEQQLVDCSGLYGNRACSGGMPVYAYRYVQHYGAESEQSYSYKGVAGPCRYQKRNVVASVKGYRTTVQGNEDSLKNAVATAGPVSVCFYATRNVRFYRQGVFRDMSCPPFSINHAVLVVGYGAENGQDYWLIKNSWGTAWGDRGYFKIARNSGNMCSIASLGIFPIV